MEPYDSEPPTNSRLDKAIALLERLVAQGVRRLATFIGRPDTARPYAIFASAFVIASIVSFYAAINGGVLDNIGFSGQTALTAAVCFAVVVAACVLALASASVRGLACRALTVISELVRRAVPSRSRGLRRYLANLPTSHAGWPFLALVRFLLACIVLTAHMWYMLPMSTLAAPINACGPFMAVLCFFVISGYSIAGSILERPAGYAGRRFRRIAPTYWLCWALSLMCALTIALRHHQGIAGISVGVWLAALLCLQGLIGVGTPAAFLPSWSMVSEIVYYALAPLFRRIHAVVLLLIAAVSVCLYVVHGHPSTWHAAQGRQIGALMFDDEKWGVAPICLIWAWLIGWLFYQHRRNPWFWILLLVPIPLLCNRSWFWHYPEAPVVAFKFLLLIGIAQFVRLEGRVKSVCIYLGDISFPLYLSHFAVLGLLVDCPIRWPSPEVSTLTGYAVTITVAIGLLHIERTLTKAWDSPSPRLSLEGRGGWGERGNPTEHRER